MSAVAKIHPHLKDIEAPGLIRTLPGWLVWRYEHVDGEAKARKIPYYTSGQRRHGVQGRPEDRQQLTTFDAAKTAAMRKGFDGVGLALLPEWGVVALDFDHCMSDGGVHPDVERMVAGTYAEYSPSGEGVRAFMRGQVGNNKSMGEPFGFEVFSSKGFVTFTGNRLDITDLLGCEDSVIDVTEDVLALCAERFGQRGQGSDAPEQPMGLSLEQIADMLAAIDPDCGHDEWLHVGMALHHETSGNGFDLWNEWSKRGGKYPNERTVQKRWESFGAGGGRQVTARTLLKIARDAGWVEPVIDEFDVLPALTSSDPAPRPNYKRHEKTGEILVTMDNAVKGVEHPGECGMTVAYDAFRDEIVFSEDQGQNWQQFRDSDYVRIRIALERAGFKPPPHEIIKFAVLLVAERNTFDSAQIWLERLVWDGVPRVEQFVPRYLNTEDNDYTRSIGRYLWTALAGRVIQPGVKADMAPVLVGDQGAGKSQAVAAIAPDPMFFTEISFGEKEDDLSRKMRGRLVAELGELRGLHTKELESIKAFITRSHEDWTPKYREFNTVFPRRLVFIGTTNKEEFLADETGNRRWLPARVGKVDVDAIKRDRLQLWAEGAVMFNQAGVDYTEAEQLARGVHEDHMMRDAWEPVVRRWLTEPDEIIGHPPETRNYLHVHEVLEKALKFETRNIKRVEEMRVGSVLRALGYTRKRLQIDGKRNWVFVKD
jgi:hypothetical protein